MSVPHLSIGEALDVGSALRDVVLHVDDSSRMRADATEARMRELGAVQDVGGGIRVAMVTDPDGNAFGLIENPHFTVPTQA